MLVCREGGELKGVLPLTLVHSPLFGRALVSNRLHKTSFVHRVRSDYCCSAGTSGDRAAFR